MNSEGYTDTQQQSYVNVEGYDTNLTWEIPVLETWAGHLIGKEGRNFKHIITKSGAKIVCSDEAIFSYGNKWKLITITADDYTALDKAKKLFMLRYNITSRYMTEREPV